ncbi:MAG: hypothetical protein KDA91_23015, partial [Planctomycetaceae bacterium]|nr:hypothetical protein [Planctomycetaceae bacterium]
CGCPGDRRRVLRELRFPGGVNFQEESQLRNTIGGPYSGLLFIVVTVAEKITEKPSTFSRRKTATCSDSL